MTLIYNEVAISLYRRVLVMAELHTNSDKAFDQVAFRYETSLELGVPSFSLLAPTMDEVEENTAWVKLSREDLRAFLRDRIRDVIIPEVSTGLPYSDGRHFVFDVDFRKYGLSRVDIAHLVNGERKAGVVLTLDTSKPFQPNE